MILINKNNIFFVCLGVLLSIALLSYFLCDAELPSCRADLVTIKRTGNIDNQITSAGIDIITFDNKKGVMQVFGEVFENERRHRIVRRSYFNYERVDGAYLLNIEKRDKSPLDDSMNNRIIPPFNMDEEMVIFEVSRMDVDRSKFIFKQFGVPMFVCVSNN
ncbi:hypothetical protein [Zobellella sp. DQSA1]|uniref:hypothetical protein n=1 Tax=Zobellella sp. DQSA1 TaxID=3342386 RepID=UPI0035BEEEBC